MKKSENKKNIFGDEYTEHRDSEGNVTGKSEAKENIFGDKYTEHRDSDGNITGKSEAKENVFGDKYTEHRDSDGNVTGKSEAKENVFGDKYTEHRDSDGKLTGKSVNKENIFGDKYTEHSGEEKTYLYEEIPDELENSNYKVKETSPMVSGFLGWIVSFVVLGIIFGFATFFMTGQGFIESMGTGFALVLFWKIIVKPTIKQYM